MTGEEIEKALGQCSEYEAVCPSCAYWELGECQDSLHKDAYLYICRLKTAKQLMGWIMANNKLLAYAEKQAVPVTQDLATSYVLTTVGIELVVDDRTFKKSYSDSTEYRFFDETTVISLTTRGVVGQTLMTSTPTEDAAKTDLTYGYIAVHQWVSDDPYTSWTKAEGVGLPVIADINNTLYLSKITTSTVSAQSYTTQASK